jgi:hypothetical protein
MSLELLDLKRHVFVNMALELLDLYKACICKYGTGTSGSL